MKQKGFSLFEVIIVIVIIGFIGGIGGKLFVTSFKNYLENKKNYQAETQINIKLARLNNYLIPLFNNFNKPLAQVMDTNGNLTTLIFAIYKNLFHQTYYSEQTYLSQIIRIDFNSSTQQIALITFQPTNSASDTLFNDSSTNFILTTAGITAPVKVEAIIGSSITKFNITYYDINDFATTALSNLVHITMQTTITQNNMPKTLNIIFSPWRINNGN